MSAAMRGLLIFGGLVLVVAFVCIGPAFFWLPQAGVGVPLPVITLPGEVLVPNWPIFGYDFTNTLTSLILVDVIVVIIALVVRRALRSQPPDKFVPRGFTNFIELIGEFIYNQTRTMAGHVTSWVFPLAASLFLFLLVANLIKLVPGTESVGIIGCAEPGYPGYTLQNKDANGNPTGPLLNVNSLDLSGRAGVKATKAELLHCEEKYPNLKPPLAIALEQRAVAAARDEAIARGETWDKEREKEAKERYHDDLILSAAPPQTGSREEQLKAAKAYVEAANPDLFVVVPFFRGLATDLNFPLALALIVVVSVQIWGVRALGASYFFKFINLPALGNLGKKPLGAIDFGVGLVEIVSEISRIISLSFRLFGNIFAGGVLLIVMTFLVAGVLPSIFYLLEIFVGLIQAYVFAVLTIIYASQAVTAHHGDDDHGHEQHAEAH